jgi:hypothetical protein
MFRLPRRPLGGSLLLLALCVTWGAARAQPAQPVTVDLSPLAPWLGAIVQALGWAAISALGYWLSGHVRNAIARQAIMAAVQHGAAGVYQTLAQNSVALSNVPIRNLTVARMASAAAQLVPSELERLGLDSDDLKPMIEHELGTLLAADPTVSITGRVAALPVSTAVAKPTDAASSPQ